MTTTKAKAKRWLTAGEVSRITGFSHQTVIRAIDTGELDGIRLPGSTHRRVRRDYLIEFCRQRNIPFQENEPNERR